MRHDIEKHGSPSVRTDNRDEHEDDHSTRSIHKSKYERWAENIKGLEIRGIEPVPLEERQQPTAWASLEMFLMWFSMGMAVNNIIAGSLGTLVLKLSYKDAVIYAIFGNLLGCLAVGYMSTFGPRSGTRTLIVARYFMGYYPSKLCCMLNIVTNLGYSMLNCVIGGQILSKVSGGHVSVIVGIVIVAFASWIMATFGMRVFQFYERQGIAWVPQLMVLCIMAGTAWPEFDFDTVSVGSPGKVNANRLTFFSLCFSVSLSWVPEAADYYVYYPPDIKRWKTWSVTVVGAYLSMIITILMGVGLGTGIAHNPQWAAIFDGTPGGLLMAAYGRLGTFGSFCAVINVLGVIANNAPGSYSMSMNFQMLGNYWLRFPRPVFTILTTIVYAGCAIGGRNSLYKIFQNFLPLMGYWTIIWLMVMIEEDLFFRWAGRRGDYDWSIWNNRRKLPIGIAAGIAFLVGWVGAIVGMNQAYYTGPIAKAVTGHCELGVWLAGGFTILSYLPLRMLELRLIGR